MKFKHDLSSSSRLSVSWTTSFVVLAIFLATTSNFGQTSTTLTRTVYVRVADENHKFVTDLTPESFNLYLDGKEQKITSVISSPQPMSVGFLVDFSGSVTHEISKSEIDEAAESIYNLSKSLGTTSEFFLIGFSRNVELLSDWSSNPEDLAAGLVKLPSLQSWKSSSVYDAYVESIIKLKNGHQKKKVLIAFTDGTDSSSKRDQGDVLKFAKSSEILFYTVRSDTRIQYNLTAEQFLKDLSDISDSVYDYDYDYDWSKHRLEDKRPFQLPFERILEELSKQYTLNYEIDERKKDESITIEVKLSLSKEIKKEKGPLYLRYRRKFPAVGS